MRSELDESLGAKAFITYEDIAQLHYTDCVYKEVLRLWPPIPEIARLVTKKIQINGFDIPVGAWIMVSSYASGRCEEYFDAPFEFEPERFKLDEGKSKISNYTYFPFSIGARNCIGQNFARVFIFNKL
jgi:cytochrome P450